MARNGVAGFTAQGFPNSKVWGYQESSECVCMYGIHFFPIEGDDSVSIPCGWVLAFFTLCFSFVDVLWAAASRSFHSDYCIKVVVCLIVFPNTLWLQARDKDSSTCLYRCFITITKREKDTFLWAWKQCHHWCGSSLNGVWLSSQYGEENWILQYPDNTTEP